jgi:hypothetical protein
MAVISRLVPREADVLANRNDAGNANPIVDRVQTELAGIRNRPTKSRYGVDGSENQGSVMNDVVD